MTGVNVQEALVELWNKLRCLAGLLVPSYLITRRILPSLSSGRGVVSARRRRRVGEGILWQSMFSNSSICIFLVIWLYSTRKKRSASM